MVEAAQLETILNVLLGVTTALLGVACREIRLKYGLMTFLMHPSIPPDHGGASTQDELGMGIHGEAGIERGPVRTADEIAQVMTERVLQDLPLTSGDRVAILVNGLGATPPEELYLLFRRFKWL